MQSEFQGALDMALGKNGKTLLILLGSTASYALNGVLEYIAIKGVDPFTFFLFWSIGECAILPFLVRGSHIPPVHIRTIRKYALALAGAFMLVGLNVSLFLAFKSYRLAEAYPLIALSSIVFFAADLVIFGRQIGRRTAATVLAGIAAVVTGVFLIGGGGFGSFSVSLIPFILAISLFSGAGYYIFSFNVRKHSAESKVSAVALLSLLLSAAFFIPYGSLGITPVRALIVMATGALFIAAVYLELHAVRLNQDRVLSRSVLMKNFINNFTYLDTVLVLLGSIIIGSYTLVEVSGAAIIVLGVVTVARARNA